MSVVCEHGHARRRLDRLVHLCSVFPIGAELTLGVLV